MTVIFIVRTPNTFLQLIIYSLEFNYDNKSTTWTSLPKLDVLKNHVRLTLRKAASLVRSGWLMMSSLMVGIQDTPSPSYPLRHVQLFRPGANGVQFACSKIYTVHRFFLSLYWFFSKYRNHTLNLPWHDIPRCQIYTYHLERRMFHCHENRHYTNKATEIIKWKFEKKPIS